MNGPHAAPLPKQSDVASASASSRSSSESSRFKDAKPRRVLALALLAFLGEDLDGELKPVKLNLDVDRLAAPALDL